jgi:hypothetical protein
MKLSTTTLFTVTFLLTALQQGIAQQLSGFFQGKGKLAVAASTTRESYDEFYFGDKKTPIEMAGFDKVVTQSINLYAAYGLTDKTDIIVNIPYIITKGRALADNMKVGEKNFQNGSIGIQTKLLEKEDSTGTLTVAGGLNFNTPLSDYETNLIYSIGNQSTQLSSSALVQYKLKNGLFANTQAGYSLRSNKVPDAIVSAAKIGYAGKVYVEGWINNQISLSGIDIGQPGFTPERFPETKVNTTTIGASVYFAGVTLGGGRRLTGRNTGLPSFYTLGLAVTF